MGRGGGGNTTGATGEVVGADGVGDPCGGDVVAAPDPVACRCVGGDDGADVEDPGASVGDDGARPCPPAVGCSGTGGSGGLAEEGAAAESRGTAAVNAGSEVDALVESAAVATPESVRGPAKKGKAPGSIK